MSLRFIIGRSGSGKTSMCLNEICNTLAANPDGSPLIYLVPEQMTFQSEYQLSIIPKLEGNIRAQVLSFSRLAWKVLQETGGITRNHLSSTGMNMLMRKIVEREKNNLRIFYRASEQAGFTEQLEEMISELKRCCVLPKDLGRMASCTEEDAENAPESQVLQDKLHDLTLIYREVERELEGRYLYGEDYLPLLAEKINLSPYLERAEIWVDGFHYFAPQELAVLRELILRCKRVSVALTLDKSYDYEQPHELNLFYQTASTYRSVKKIASDWGVKIEELVNLSEREGKEKKRFQDQPALAHLEQNYDVRPPVASENNQGIELKAAVNRRTEVEQVAREILTLVRDDNYRFRDLAVMVRDISSYGDLIQTVFKDYQIPVFLDHKRLMLHHPLVELIRSSLEVVTRNWDYEAVFRCAKTDLLFPLEDWSRIEQMREQMDQLENFVLAFGIRGKRWTSSEPWEFGTAKPSEMVNNLRKVVAEPLVNYQQELKGAVTGRDMCTSLYSLLESLHVPTKIERWQKKAQQEGNVEQAREHAQVWKAVIDLLDQIVEVIGEEEVSLELFAQMLETGLGNMRFALVPPALDQVVVATLDRSRLSQVKCAFLIGVNEGVLPAKPDEKGILSEEERESMVKAGFDLGPDSTRKLLDEYFLIYNALTSASDRLWISYPMADEEGKAMFPSNLINFIKRMFPKVKEELTFAEPREMGGAEALNFITGPLPTLSYLLGQLNQWKKGYPISGLWWDAYNWFVTDDLWKQSASELLQGLSYYNQEHNLGQQTGRSLYGTKLATSVSRVEKFQACPFAHFAAHGLKLKERRIFRLEAPDIGKLFHEALTVFAEQIVAKNLSWNELSQDECNHIASSAVEQLAPKIQGEILLSSSRHHYLTRRLKQVVGRSAFALSRQMGQGSFKPEGLELGFGGENDVLPSLRFQLENDAEIELVGRIDRVDVAESDKGLYIRVVDYKSGETKLDLTEVYYGLALQMLTYLDVLVANSVDWLGREAIPAGVLYFHIHNPLLSSTKAMSREEIEKLLFKEFKMKGLVLADKEAVQLMDRKLGKGSDIIPVGLKKDGDFAKFSSVVGLEELAAIRKHVRSIFLETGREITDGKIEISPYKLKKKNSCKFCAYSSLCQFDQALEENQYRLLPEQDQSIVIKKIMEKGSGGHEQ